MRPTTSQMAERSKQNFKMIGVQLGAVLLLASMNLFGREEFIRPFRPELQEIRPATRVLVLSIPDRKLALTEDGVVLKTFCVAVGKPSTPSPAGEMKIINKVTDPTYYHEGTVVKPGKSNPLGSRWMGLSKPGYGIHGTNVQNSVGKAASHGCFRMRKHDVEELFTLVRVGDVVEIHAERDAKVAAIFVDPEKNVIAEPPTSVAHVLVPTPVAAESRAGGN
ncbi:MAG TPA: L,D-transpeptidase [Terriglobia bacterium]|nr:L,D-transpeptidase [Terriglobia bacterium]